MINELLAVMGMALIIALVLLVLEKARKEELYKMIYMISVLVFCAVILGMLGQLFSEANSVFHIFT